MGLGPPCVHGGGGVWVWGPVGRAINKTIHTAVSKIPSYNGKAHLDHSRDQEMATKWVQTAPFSMIFGQAHPTTWRTAQGFRWYRYCPRPPTLATGSIFSVGTPPSGLHTYTFGTATALHARCYTPFVTSAGVGTPPSRLLTTSRFCTSAPQASSYKAQRARLQTPCYINYICNALHLHGSF